MIPRHEKLLEYDCKEYLIDIPKHICVNKFYNNLLACHQIKKFEKISKEMSKIESENQFLT